MQRLLPWNAELLQRAGDAADIVAQKLFAQCAGLGWMEPDIALGARAGFNQTLVLQQAEGLLHGVWIDAEQRREHAARGQLVAV